MLTERVLKSLLTREDRYGHVVSFIQVQTSRRYLSVQTFNVQELQLRQRWVSDDAIVSLVLEAQRPFSDPPSDTARSCLFPTAGSRSSIVSVTVAILTNDINRFGGSRRVLIAGEPCSNETLRA